MENKVADYREKAGFTQNRLARALGVTRNTISNWEQGGSIKSEYLARMAAIFNCDAFELIGYASEDATVATA